MRFFLRDQQQSLRGRLAEMKPLPLSFDDLRGFPDRQVYVETAAPAGHTGLGRLDFFYAYQVFPEEILTFFGEWETENRTMREGDIIVQQAKLPPCPLNLKLVFGVRVTKVWRHEREAGFSYGTLPGHPERGVNTFTLRREGGALTITIRTQATSGLPTTRLLERIATFPYAAYCNRRAVQHIAGQYRAANPSPPERSNNGSFRR